MADKFEWREITDQEVMRKSTVIRAAIFLVLIFIGILVINDFVFYRYMNRAETHTSTEQEKGTTPG